ncbi:MAG: LytTR family transcriptional regulator DNA-binding domain-containing protein [Bacteroidales bacterium]|nr:LytTR family transcriptional regulator DNA-binding domain-containing protein [Bacteroidales bacterium]
MEWLKISTSTELVRVQTDDIVFVAADGNYSDIYLFDGKPLKMTFQLHYFDDVFQRLRANSFVRVGRGLIVNRNYINNINLTTQELRLNGTQLRSEFRLKASREALKELKSLLEQEGDKA